MKERELLELAALSAGINVDEGVFVENPFSPDGYFRNWDPVNDDGDSFRLAVNAGITIHPSKIDNYCRAKWCRTNDGVIEYYADYNDRAAAVRHAVFKAAVQKGQYLQGLKA